MLNSLVDLSKNSTMRDGAKFALSLLSLATIFCTNSQTYAAPIPDSASSLMPLEEGRPSNYSPSAELGAAEESINAEFANAQNPEAKADESGLVEMPFVSDLVDGLMNENGKFDWGMDIPISFDFGNLLGEPVLIVGTDFPTN